jgi:rod shape-determining protein MreC
MLKRSHYIALSLVVLLTLLILNLPSHTAFRLKRGLGSLFLPLVGLSSSTQEVAGATGDLLTPRRELLRENAVLRRENERLQAQEAQAKELARENAELRRLLGWRQQQRWKLRLANVVLRDPANWWRTVQIDLGARDGLTNNMPVLANDGALVGRIGSVSLTRSQVVLLGDPNLKVSARVENDAHDTGVIGSSGPVESEFVEMGYLTKNAVLKPGQAVVTSGNGGIFPSGIPVGQVVDSQAVDYGLRISARVKLAANLDALEKVWVMVP